MSESPAAAPGLEEARRWVGYRADEIGGAEVGQVHGLFVDAEDGRPTWVIARQGRLKGTLVAIPIDSCAAGAGRIWVAQERDAIRSAPVVDPTRPLLREHELTICAHYGVGESVGRAAAVAGRDEGAITSQPV
jgi:PRC-barrel domain